mgnify:CR=1 FL=1
MIENNHLEILKKFDVVMQHHLKINENSTRPLYKDFKSFEKARLETMELAKKGLLNDMYNRIMEGRI